MRTNHRVIPFPASRECSPFAGHIVSGGGMSVNIKHQHPTYQSEQDRLQRLQELRKVCITKISGMKQKSRTA